MIGGLRRAHAWLARVEVASELERRQAVSLQVFAIVGAVFMAGLEAWRALSGAGAGVRVATLSNVASSLVLVSAVWAVRAGRFRLGARIFAFGTTAVLGAIIAFSGLVFARDALKNLAIPLALAALVLGRRALWGTVAAILLVVSLAFARDLGWLGGAGARVNPSPEGVLFAVSAIVFVLIAIVLDRFGLSVLDAFADSESKRRELEAAIAERLRVEREQEQLRAQLLQAQKIESVGRLAGGVAHDFNNLLTVINGCGEALLESLPPDSPLRADVGDILSAGDRAAALTRQLLAFSRQQVLEPRLLDLNQVIESTRRMLARLLGEDMELSLSLEPGLGRVLADASQIQQVLVNLAVNARDAMPSGGRLTVATANADGPVAAGGSPAARHVRVSVSDDGVGMSEETRRRAFEPFFTTKPPGQGTGLGLSTVYGIVEQSGGRVEIASVVGAGTTLTIHLPLVQREAAPAAGSSDAASAHPHAGEEAILVVDDQDDVRRVTARMLRGAGYRVLEAARAEEALAVAAEHVGPLHLLVTDVVMPGMSGLALAARLAAVRPEIRVLFLSGYAPDEFVRRGLLDGGLAYLQKPFTAAALAGKVREALADAPYRPDAEGGRS